jgi:hypothetical protein
MTPDTVREMAAQLVEQAAALRALADRLEEGEDTAEMAPVEQPEPGGEEMETYIAACRFGIPPDTLRLWLRSGDDLGRKIGGRWRVNVDRLRARIAAESTK